MDLLAERWSEAAAGPDIRLVRIHAEENEKQMVQTFYTWLLGVDTPNKDIPIIFEMIFHDEDQYTNGLLKEVERLLDIWNNANSDALAVKPNRISWTPDYRLVRKGNAAYPFVANMNRLASYLALDRGVFLVLVLKVSFVEQDPFTRWLSQALTAGISPQVRVLIDDSVSHPFYHTIAAKHREAVVTLHPRLDMDSALQQVAAMGKPDDPQVLYRRSFIALMQAIEKRKQRPAEEHAAACIAIAEANVTVNVYWIGQHIAVYTAMANDQVGYKNYRKAIEYASLAVGAAERSQVLVEDQYISRKFVAQAVMVRGALYVADRRWNAAVGDFERAAENYTFTNDPILAMEAWRMKAFAHRKSGDADACCRALADGLAAARKIPDHLLKFTTFPGIVEMLLEVNNGKYCTRAEVEDLAMSVYGNNWMKEIRNWKSPTYEHIEDPNLTVVS